MEIICLLCLNNCINKDLLWNLYSHFLKKSVYLSGNVCSDCQVSIWRSSIKPWTSKGVLAASNSSMTYELWSIFDHLFRWSFFFFPNILVLLLDFIVKYGLCQRRWVSYWCWGKSYLCGFGNYYWNWNLIFSIFIFLFFSAGGWLTTRQGSGAHNFVLHFSFLTFFYVTVVDSHVLLTLVLWIPCLQDIRPRFHSSRFHGSDDMNDDVWFYILNWMLDFVFGRLYSLPSHNLTSK